MPKYTVSRQIPSCKNREPLPPTRVVKGGRVFVYSPAEGKFIAVPQMEDPGPSVVFQYRTPGGPLGNT